jgi:hypothetical protein
MTDPRNVAHPRKVQRAHRSRIADPDPAVDVAPDWSVDDEGPPDPVLAADETLYLREFQGDRGLDDDDPADQKAPGEEH